MCLVCEQDMVEIVDPHYRLFPSKLPKFVLFGKEPLVLSKR